MTAATRDARILFIAGEASGDGHAAAVLRALRKARPRIRALALGGDRLREAGAEIVYPLARHAVTGIVEVAKSLPVFVRALDLVRELARRRDFDLVVPIDFPDFNLRAAKIARSAGIGVYWYIAPQVWAWRKGRAKDLAALASRIGVIFPFEVEILRAAGARVDFVGHPLLEAPAPAPERVPRSSDRPLLGLFPGSRENERARHIPAMRAAAELLPGYESRLSDPRGAGEGYPGPARDLLAASAVNCTKTGTISLESALLGRPTVSMYRMNSASWMIAKALVRVPYAAMPNLLLGRAVVPELLQSDATPARIAAAVEDVAGRASEFREAGEELRSLLSAGGGAGGSGAAARAAEGILATLDEAIR